MSDQLKKEASTAIAQARTQMQTAQKNSTLSMVKSLLTNEELKKRFNDILGKKSGQFLGSITSLVSSSTAFNDCDPNSIISAALIAATLDLPINPSLGFAYVIPLGLSS